MRELSEPVEKPGWARGCRAVRLDAGPQCPVGGDHLDVPVVATSCPGCLDDRVVARAWCVNRVYTTLLTGRYALSGGPFEHEDDLVLRQVRRDQLLPQPPRSSCPVTPPAVRAAAHHVCAIDDERLHLSRVGGRPECGSSGLLLRS